MRALRTILVICVVSGSCVLLAMRIFDKKRTELTNGGLTLTCPGQQAATLINKKLVDSAVTMLQPGYLVLRMGLGADSRILAQMNQKNKCYSHCGIVMIEHGYPFVYHSIGGEDNPDERLRRDSASFFFSPRYNTSLAIVKYDIDSVQIAQLRKVVYAYYKRKPKFDMQFDLKTDDKLYCAEFVYKALNKATSDTGFIKTTSVAGYKFVGVDNLFVNQHAQMIWQTVFK